MKNIFKYPLEVADEQMIQLPRNARLLTVQAQRDKVCLWALVENEEATDNVRIRCLGTGHPASDIRSTDQFLGTVQLMGGSLVFHFFAMRS